jgi:hypothetical protein
VHGRGGIPEHMPPGSAVVVLFLRLQVAQS